MMDHGWWGKAVGIACAGMLAFGGAAAAAPNGDPGPPEQAQGNGPPAPPPGQVKKQQAPAATTQPGGDAHGKSTGGHAKARGNGHAGGDGHTGGSGQAKGQATVPSVNSMEGSSNGHAGKTTICHATHSSTNPYVEITPSNNAIPAHDRHQDDEDIIPAPEGGCPGGESGAAVHGNGNENGKVTICHATGSDTNPYVRITVSVHALPAHTRHQDGEDIVNPTGDCPSSAVAAGVGSPPSGIVSGNTQAAGAPESGAGEAPASVLGAEQGGVEGATQVASTSGGSLPFTGLGVGLLVALGALLALTGLVVRRRTAKGV